jgi:hypothetical protein
VCLCLYSVQRWGGKTTARDDGTVQSISLSVTTPIYLCTYLPPPPHPHSHSHTNDTTTTASAHPKPTVSSPATYRPPDPRY